MMRSRRTTSVLLLALIPVAIGWPGPGWTSDPGEPPHADALQANAEAEAGSGLPVDLEEFRTLVLGFVHDMDDVLQRAVAHPAIASRAASTVSPVGLVQVPLSEDVYAAFENADSDQLTRLRDAFSQFPDVFDTPRVLEQALAQLPATDPGRDAAATCGDNYAEWSDVVSFQASNRAVKRTLHALQLAYSILDTITEAVCAATEDLPYVGCRPVVPLMVIRGILGTVNVILSFAADLIDYEVDLAELCLASCLTDEGDIHGEPTARWRGRGCDNRDNNCANGIDDDAEDRFAPTVSFDAAIVNQCFANATAAQDAVTLAVKASDDCTDPSVSVSLGSVSPTTCEAPFSVTATDAAGNATQANAAFQKVLVDGTPPQVTPATLAACYPSVAAARAEFTGSGLMVSDCTAVDLDVKAVEKECVADFELTATDRCGNRTQVRDRARIDATAPDVNIERLLIPSVDGLSCFDTQADALAAVAEATIVSDSCTTPEHLVQDLTTSGDSCNLLVTASAADQCGNASSDSLLVRVDSNPPKVSCSVATSILYPADEAFVDIGFSYTASDPCEPAGPQVQIDVTSDEPTSLAETVIPGADLFPDAFVRPAPNGGIPSILLRAQRSKANTADGRVYRIRVTATDSCGLSDYADCFVTVPRSQPGPGSAINSGQGFDATREN